MRCPLVQACCERQCRAMVSGRMGCNIAVDARFPEPGNRIAGAPKFEGTCALQVFTFAHEFTTQFRIETVTGENGCAVHQVSNAPVCLLHGSDIRDDG